MSSVGRDVRVALWSAETSLRPELPAYHTTTVGLLPYSVRSFTSIEAKPKIAFVGKPVEVAIDSGRAKKARYASELPSIRKSSSCCPLPSPAMADHPSVRIERGARPPRMPFDEGFRRPDESHVDRSERLDRHAARARADRPRRRRDGPLARPRAGRRG